MLVVFCRYVHLIPKGFVGPVLLDQGLSLVQVVSMKVVGLVITCDERMDDGCFDVYAGLTLDWAESGRVSVKVGGWVAVTFCADQSKSNAKEALPVSTAVDIRPYHSLLLRTSADVSIPDPPLPFVSATISISVPPPPLQKC